MRDQLKLLEELQRHDAKLQETEVALKAIPQRLESMKADLARVEAFLERERQTLAETEKFRREQDLQLKTDEGSIQKAKAKLQQVKGGKDYNAAQREVDNTRKAVSDREEELLKLIDVIEASKKRVAAHEADVAQLRAHVAKEDEKANAEVEEIRAQTAGERAARDEVASKVSKDLMKRYSSIRMRRGLAVVPMRNGTCQGCQMKVPPQLSNTIMRGLTIETCPSCARLIYWEDLLKDHALEEGER